MTVPGRQVSLRHQFAVRARQWHQEKVQAILPPPPGPLCSHRQLAAARELVVRRDAGLGDCLMILPTLEALRQRYPHLRIIFQVPTPYTELLAGFAVVDEARPLEAAGEVSASGVAFADLSNYMERHPRAWSQPRIDLVGTAFAIQPVPEVAHYQPPPADKHAARQWLKQPAATRHPRLGIVLRGIYGHRSWLVPYVFELAGQFAAHYGEVIIFDADAEAPCYRAADSRNSVGTVASAYGLELPTVAALLAECDVVVVPDTGLLHLAACVGTPFVAIFGAVPPQLRLNYYRNYRCLTAANMVDCVPCREGSRHRRCQHECLWAITPAQVMEAVEELLGDSGQWCRRRRPF